MLIAITPVLPGILQSNHEISTELRYSVNLPSYNRETPIDARRTPAEKDKPQAKHQISLNEKRRRWMGMCYAVPCTGPSLRQSLNRLPLASVPVLVARDGSWVDRRTALSRCVAGGEQGSSRGSLDDEMPSWPSWRPKYEGGSKAVSSLKRAKLGWGSQEGPPSRKKAYTACRPLPCFFSSSKRTDAPLRPYAPSKEPSYHSERLRCRLTLCGR